MGLRAASLYAYYLSTISVYYITETVYYYVRVVEKIRKFFSKREQAFLVAFLFFGLLFVFITPPIYTVDESAHLYRAYQVSELNLIPDNIGNEAGGSIPQSLTTFVLGYIEYQGKGLDFVRYNVRQLKVKVSPQQRTDITFTNVAIYPFVNYIPQATGMAIGRLFTQSLMVQFYLARLTNLLFLGGCFFVALRLFGKRNHALFAIGLLPMTLYVGASLSADTFVIGSVAVFTAYLYKLLKQEEITTKQWIIVASLAALVALSKQTYFVLTLAILALAWRKPQFKKENLLIPAACVVASLVPFLTVMGISRGLNTRPVTLQQTVGIVVDASAQKDFVIHHPLSFINIVWETLSNPGLFNNFFGSFGVGTVSLPPWALFIACVSLFLSFGMQTKKDRSDKRVALLLAAVGLVNVGAILVGLYLFWSNPLQDHISGLQSRYFIPILIVLIPALIGLYKHTIKWRTIVIAMLIVLAASIVTITRAFY